MASQAVLELLIRLKDEASGMIGSLGQTVAGLGVVGAAGAAALGGAVLSVSSDTAATAAALQAQLGLTAEEAAALGEVALQVFGDNWTGSVQDAGAIVGELRRQLGELEAGEMRALAGGVAAIADNFGAETPAIINAVKAIRENFPGTTEQEALDMIAAGFQRGLDSSGDFLETITEYGVQFGDGGASASEFFSVLESGLQGGVLGTDKAADAFKEFRLRIGDGSKATESALAGLGLADLNDKLALGAVTAAEAFQEVQTQLSKVKDPALQMQLATALIGTQFEDLGAQAFLGIDMARTSLTDLSGATDSLSARYTSLQDVGSGLWRQLLVTLAPFGDQLLTLANEQMPLVEAGFSWLQENLPPALAAASEGFGALSRATGQVIGFLQANAMPILAGLSAALIALAPVIYGMVIPPFLAWATAAITSAMATAAALAPVVIPVVAIGAAVALLAAAWQNDWGGIRTATTAFWEQTGRPIFEQLKVWLDTTLTGAAQALSDFWTGTLQPALAAVGDWIETHGVPLFNDFMRGVDAVVKIAGDLAAMLSGALTGAINGAQGVITGISGWFNHIADAIKKVVDWVQRLIDKLASVAVPEWLQGQSPPPMADWFSYIAEAAGQAREGIGDFTGAARGIALPELASATRSAGAELSDRRGGGGGMQRVQIEIMPGPLSTMVRTTVREREQELVSRSSARRK